MRNLNIGSEVRVFSHPGRISGDTILTIQHRAVAIIEPNVLEASDRFKQRVRNTIKRFDLSEEHLLLAYLTYRITTGNKTDQSDLISRVWGRMCESISKEDRDVLIGSSRQWMRDKKLIRDRMNSGIQNGIPGFVLSLIQFLDQENQEARDFDSVLEAIWALERTQWKNAASRELDKLRRLVAEVNALGDQDFCAWVFLGFRQSILGHSFSSRLLASLGPSPRFLDQQSSEYEAEGVAVPGDAPVGADDAHSAPGSTPWLPRLPRASDEHFRDCNAWHKAGSAHRGWLCRAVGTFLDEFLHAVDHRDPELYVAPQQDPDQSQEEMGDNGVSGPEPTIRLRDRVRPTCYVWNARSDEIEYIDLNHAPGVDGDGGTVRVLPDGICPLRYPHILGATGVARTLPKEFLSFEGPGVRVRAFNADALRDHKIGRGHFIQRERVREVWTLHYSTGKWDLLLVLNWVDPEAVDGISDYPVGFDAATREQLKEILRDTQAGARQLMSWISASDLDLSCPDQRVLPSFYSVLSELKQIQDDHEEEDVFSNHKMFKRLVRTGLQHLEPDISNRCTYADCLVAPLFFDRGAGPSSDAHEYFVYHLIPDKDAGKLWFYPCGQSRPALPDKITSRLSGHDHHDLRQLATMGLARAPRIMVLIDKVRVRSNRGKRGTQDYRTVFRCDPPREGETRLSVTALAAAWGVPIRIDDLSEKPEEWLPCGDPKDEQYMAGSELSVPVLGACCKNGRLQTTSIIHVHSETKGGLDQRCAKAVDSLARLYGHLRFAHHDPLLDSSARTENQRLIQSMIDNVHQAVRIEELLETACTSFLSWTQAKMAYFLVRDRDGHSGFRPVGLSYHDDIIGNYFDFRDRIDIRKQGQSGRGSQESIPIHTDTFRAVMQSPPGKLVVSRAIRSHLTPRRDGYSNQIIREMRGCVVHGNDLEKTASKPDMLRALGITHTAGLVFSSPYRPRAIGCLWLCFDDGHSLPHSTQIDRELLKRSLESRLGSILDALGAFYSCERACETS